MNISRVQVNHNGQRLGLVRLHKEAEMRKRYVDQLPAWRHPLVGYVLAVPCVGLAILVVLLERGLLASFYFPGVPLMLSVLLIALIWGVGPALFSVLLGTLALDYVYIAPYDKFDFYTLDGLFQILPFVIAGIIVAVIVGQRESARRRALFAEQEAQEHAHELEQANEELKQLNLVKDQFLSMASHELKTPITTIRGQAQIMLRRLSKQQELPKELVDVQTALTKIDEQTYRLTALINDLLDLGSIRSGKIDLRLSACDVYEICCGVVEEQRLLSGRTIELEETAEPMVLQCDFDRLSQVVTNLVSNALKYSSSESPVRVVVRRLERVVRIEVQDAGQGITPEQQAYIFEPFYRTPDAHSSKQSGWGLGLAICKDIVERHGGSIYCESKVGKGSTFIVELPIQ